MQLYYETLSESRNNEIFFYILETLPDALSTGCSKCNDKQKTTAEKVINYLKMKRSKDWDRLISKYDSNFEYRKRFDQS